MLVKRYAGDVTTISVLNELNRTASVSRPGPGFVQLAKPLLRTGEEKKALVATAANQMENFSRTLLLSLQDSGHPTFTGYREAKSLSSEVAAVFVKTFTERSALLLEAVERWLALQPRHRHGVRAGDLHAHRVGIGIYLVDEPAGSRAPLPPRRQHKRRAKSSPESS